MSNQVGTSQRSSRFSCSWLSLGVLVVFFMVFLSVLLQIQLSLQSELKSLQTELKELRQESNSIRLLTKSVVDKLEEQPSGFIPLSFSR